MSDVVKALSQLVCHFPLLDVGHMLRLWHSAEAKGLAGSSNK